MNFTFDINSEPVDAALEEFENSLADNSGALRLIADDLRGQGDEEDSIEEGVSESTDAATRGES